MSRKATFIEMDSRDPRRRRVTIRDAALLYGQRPKDSAVWYLSPYEFVMQWEPGLASHPLPMMNESQDEKHHVNMTPEGKARLRAKATGHVLELVPGADYVVRKGGTVWFAFPDVPSTQHFRRTWVIERRQRPRTSSFPSKPLPKHRLGEESRSATIVMAYFHPWTLLASRRRLRGWKQRRHQ